MIRQSHQFMKMFLTFVICLITLLLSIHRNLLRLFKALFFFFRHEELLALNGVYKNMWRQQSKHGEEGVDDKSQEGEEEAETSETSASQGS